MTIKYGSKRPRRIRGFHLSLTIAAIIKFSITIKNYQVNICLPQPTLEFENLHNLEQIPTRQWEKWVAQNRQTFDRS